MLPDSTPDAATLDEIRRFEAQYARSPESLVFARLADAYRKAGMLERALEVVEAGLVRHQGYLSAHIVRGRTLRELGRLEAATAAFHRVLDVDPQNLVALRALGEIARDRGRPEEAREWYERLAEVDPLDEQVRSTLEVLDELALQSEEAPAEPDREPAAESVDSDALVESDEWEESEQSVREPLTEPAADEAMTAMEPGRPTDVTEEQATPAESTEGQPAPPDTPPGAGRGLATLTMAELYMRQGLYEEAERVYRQLVRFHPDDSSLREKLHAVAVLVRGEEPAAERSGHTPQGEAFASAARGRPGSEGRPADGPPEGSPGGSTIRRHLHALLDGRSTAIEDVPRPSAFDAWLEREARR